VPNLLTYPGSVIIIDPKGEAAAIGARRRREIVQKVHIIDPWGVTGGKAVLGARSTAIVLIIFVLDAPNYFARMIGL
jgi:type IV secretion system protein VirD4